MKRAGSLCLILLACTGLAAALTSCVTADGRVAAGIAVSYGPYHGWFYDRPGWDHWPWWRGGIYVQPPPIIIGRSHGWPAIPNRPRVHHRP